jgi:hypothetical protein
MKGGHFEVHLCLRHWRRQKWGDERGGYTHSALQERGRVGWGLWQPIASQEDDHIRLSAWVIFCLDLA